MCPSISSSAPVIRRVPSVFSQKPVSANRLRNSGCGHTPRGKNAPRLAISVWAAQNGVQVGLADRPERDELPR